MASWIEELSRKPVLLTPNNFTSPQKTPWAGQTISAAYKKKWSTPGQAIGESWEFSCDPEFPSRLLEKPDVTLLEIVNQDPDSFLSSQESKRTNGMCEILVKLLNAKDPLSLQVHPTDHDPFLKVNECGKPESWYILQSEPNAGIYLGFFQAMEKDFLFEKLKEKKFEKKLLYFHETKPGEFFNIAPGVSHAIGGGVTLLEPQRIIKGKSGKTYRMWDWDRKYDGKERELHIEPSLRIIDPMTQVGEKFVSQLKKMPQEKSKDKKNYSWLEFPSTGDYSLHIIETFNEPVTFNLSLDAGYIAYIPLKGGSKINNIILPEEVPAMFPFKMFPCQKMIGANTKIALVVAKDYQLKFF